MRNGCSSLHALKSAGSREKQVAFLSQNREFCFYSQETTMLKKIQDSHKHGKKNTANSAPLANLARVGCADDKDPDNRDNNGRLALGCL
jgi:hypothetical protein